MLPLGALLLSSNLLIAVADHVPKIDLGKTCRIAASVIGAPTKNDIDVCIADEQDAHNQIVKDWGQFPAIAKDRCIRASTEYLPSYVEMITCLQMTKDAKDLSEDKNLSGDTVQRPRRRRQ
jgi:hypothetical protein